LPNKFTFTIKLQGMNSERERKLWNTAKQDLEFRKVLLESDGDTIPFFASSLDKLLITSIYYGYLISKHGKNWENYLIH